MSKQATLADVAALANVSVITASRAMRGQSHVAAATREKVLAAATELGYSPDVLARTMRGASSKLIGVFLIGFGSMVLHELLVGVEAEAHRHGYDLVVTNVAIYDNGRTAGADMLLKLCEGVIWLLPSADNSLMAKLETGAVPAVLVNYVARNAPLPVVSGDNYARARALTEHLRHRRQRRPANAAALRPQGPHLPLRGGRLLQYRVGKGQSTLLRHRQQYLGQLGRTGRLRPQQEHQPALGLPVDRRLQ